MHILTRCPGPNEPRMPNAKPVPPLNANGTTPNEKKTTAPPPVAEVEEDSAVQMEQSPTLVPPTNPTLPLPHPYPQPKAMSNL